MRYTPALACALLALAVSCSHKPAGWSVSGTVETPADTTLLLQTVQSGRWHTIDTIALEQGRFSYESPAPSPYPTIMRLALGDNYLYFPVDSADHITVTAPTAGFGPGAAISGTPQATTIATLDSIINANSTAIAAGDPTLKTQLFARAFADPSILPLYYLINRTVGGRQLYDISQRADARVYGAVAQRFATERPDDPRGQYLAGLYKQARAQSAAAAEPMQIVVPQTGLIDITRCDGNGREQSLAEVASRGNVVLLSFTNYSLPTSPDYNLLLGELYQKYHDRGLEIYQIAFDGDESSWKQTARNLPWITVWNSTTDDLSPITSYNVGALPQAFVIDRSGTLRQRILNPDNIAAEVAKYM